MARPSNQQILDAVLAMGSRLDARIDAVNARIDTLTASMSGRIDTLIDSIGDLRADLDRHTHD